MRRLPTGYAVYFNRRPIYIPIEKEEAVMKKGCKVFFCIVALAILCFSYVSAFAGSLTDDELKVRIDFIQDRLDEGTTNAKRWQYSWMFINGSISYLEFGLATTYDDRDEADDHYDSIVGGITGLLAVGDLTVNPLVAWSASEKLRNYPDTTIDEKRAKLRYAEKLLKDCADREEYGRSWKTHAMAGVVNLLAGAAITCDGGRAGDGALAFASGMLVSEIQIFTMPTRAVNDWEDYLKMSSEGFRSARKKSWRNRFFITVHPHGLYCSILF
jgi:hypothetical protein